MRLNQGYESGKLAILNMQSGTNKIKDDLAPISLEVI